LQDLGEVKKKMKMMVMMMKMMSKQKKSTKTVMLKKLKSGTEKDQEMAKDQDRGTQGYSRFLK
jgi:hypothetical protein